MALISEEVQAQNLTLGAVVDKLVEVILKRAHAGKKYGIALVPEGLPEFIPEIKTLIFELRKILVDNNYAGLEHLENLRSHEERIHYLNKRLTDHSARVYGQLPTEIQEVLLKLDDHDNVPLSQVETERLLIDMVSDRLRDLHPDKEKLGDIFSPLSHFLGYEGRCGAPSNFDADYGYALGYTAAQLIRAGLTSYTAHVRNLARPVAEWVAGGTPITALMNIEMRGRPKPVVRKSLVDLQGKPFKIFAAQRETWAREDAYVFPGPIQYFGPPEICDAATITLQSEWS